MTKSPPRAPLVICDEPIAVSLFEPQLSNYCSGCLLPSGGTLKRCASCQHLYYCSKECQKRYWKSHKLECPHMANLPAGVFSAIMDQKQDAGYADQIMMLRLFLGYKHLGLDRLQGKVTGRKVTDFMTHVGSSHGTAQMVVMHFQMDMAKRCFPGVYKPGEAGEEAMTSLMMEIYGAIQTNATTSWQFDATGSLVAIGQILSLDVSSFDHSCRPNAVYVTEGRTTYVIPCEDGLDMANRDSIKIHYVDLSLPRPLRRAQLAERYHFDCACTKCNDPTSDTMTDILCEKCGCELSLPLCPTEDEAFLSKYKCKSTSCGHVQSWPQVNLSRDLMILIGHTVGMARIETFNWATQTDHYMKLEQQMQQLSPDSEKMGRMVEMTRKFLAPANVFRNAMNHHAILQMEGGASIEVLTQFAMNHKTLLQRSYVSVHTEEKLFVFLRALQALVKLNKPFEDCRSIFEQIEDHLKVLYLQVGRPVPDCFDQCREMVEKMQKKQNKTKKRNRK